MASDPIVIVGMRVPQFSGELNRGNGRVQQYRIVPTILYRFLMVAMVGGQLNAVCAVYFKSVLICNMKWKYEWVNQN